MRSFWCSLICLWILPFLLSGCANFSSVHHNLDTSHGQGVLIDIKQRAILASIVEERPEDGPAFTHPVVCADPSPDSLSAYAFDLAAQGSLPTGKSVTTNLGSSESSAFVGLRTQSIQLLRDQFFRACEAYLNRAASAGEYNFLIRRYQKQTAALLAIEQLTSMISVPAAAVSASGANNDTHILFLESLYKENKDKIAGLEKKTAETGATDEQKKSAKTEIDSLTKDNSDIAHTLSSAGVAKAPAAVSDTTKEKSVAENKRQLDLDVIAKTVSHIVDGVILTDDFLQLCLIKYGITERDDKLPHPEPPLSTWRPRNMEEACMVRMTYSNNQVKLRNETIEKYVANVINDRSLTAAQVREALLKVTPKPEELIRGSDN